MKHLKVLSCITAACVCFSLVLPVCSAWWGSPIKPYDHVFDAVRFADSVRETEEMLNTAINTARMAALRELNNLPIVSEINKALNDFRQIYASIRDITGGSTILNQSISLEDRLVFHRNWSMYSLKDNGNTYARDIFKEVDKSHIETLEHIGRILERENSRNEAVRDISGTAAEGNLGERQKHNALALTLADSKSDELRSKVKEMLNRINEREALSAGNALFNQQKKVTTIKGYDPFHPSSVDQANNNSESHNFGFIKMSE